MKYIIFTYCQNSCTEDVEFTGADQLVVELYFSTMHDSEIYHSIVKGIDL